MGTSVQSRIDENAVDRREISTTIPNDRGQTKTQELSKTLNPGSLHDGRLPPLSFASFGSSYPPTPVEGTTDTLYISPSCTRADSNTGLFVEEQVISPEKEASLENSATGSSVRSIQVDQELSQAPAVILTEQTNPYSITRVCGDRRSEEHNTAYLPTSMTFGTMAAHYLQPDSPIEYSVRAHTVPNSGIPSSQETNEGTQNPGLMDVSDYILSSVVLFIDLLTKSASDVSESFLHMSESFSTLGSGTLNSPITYTDVEDHQMPTADMPGVQSNRIDEISEVPEVQIAQSASEGQNENEDEITHQFQRSFAVSRIDQESASNGIEVARTVSPTRGPLTPPNATINASPVDYQPSVPADHQRESLDKTKEYDRGPPHTEERPNWALAPEDPPDMIPTGSATRGRGRGRGRGGLRGRGRGRNNEGRGGNGGRRGRGSRSRSRSRSRNRTSTGDTRLAMSSPREPTIVETHQTSCSMPDSSTPPRIDVRDRLTAPKETLTVAHTGPHLRDGRMILGEQHSITSSMAMHPDSYASADSGEPLAGAPGSTRVLNFGTHNPLFISQMQSRSLTSMVPASSIAGQVAHEPPADSNVSNRGICDVAAEQTKAMQAYTAPGCDPTHWTMDEQGILRRILPAGGSTDLNSSKRLTKSEFSNGPLMQTTGSEQEQHERTIGQLQSNASLSLARTQEQDFWALIQRSFAERASIVPSNTLPQDSFISLPYVGGPAIDFHSQEGLGSPAHYDGRTLITSGSGHAYKNVVSSGKVPSSYTSNDIPQGRETQDDQLMAAGQDGRTLTH